MKKRIKIKNNFYINILLTVSFISIILNFIVIIFFKNDSNLIINLVGNLILSIFAVFFILQSLQATYNRNNKLNIVCASILLIGYSIFQICNNLGALSILKLNTVPDFSNKYLTEVIKYAEKNNIKLNQIYEYSDSIDEYKIISQSKKSDTLTKDVKSLTVVVSEGFNEEKEITVANMINWSDSRVLEYIEENKLTNVSVSFVESDKDPNTVIEQDKSGNLKRNEEINLVFSIGDINNLEDIKLVNLKNMKKFNAEFYLKKNAIKYDVETSFSKKIKRDYVIGTNKKVGENLKPNNEDDKLILKVSKGEEIKVPNLEKYSLIDLTNWIIENKLKLEVDSKYDDSKESGEIIDVNVNTGDIIEQKSLIKVTISKGKLVMASFKDLDEFRTWALKYEINYEEKYEFSDDFEEGKVISYSHRRGDTIKNGDTVIVTISKGSKVKVPNVLDDTKASAIKKLENAKLKYNFVYENSTKDKNIVIKQSLAANSEVSKNTTITITLSNGKKPTSSSSRTSSKSNSSTTDTQTNNNTQSEQKTEECDRTVTTTVTIQSSLNGSSLSETAANYRRAYPNVKFSFVGKASSVGNNGMVHPDSSSKRVITVNYCDTYTIYIIEN